MPICKVCGKEYSNSPYYDECRLCSRECYEKNKMSGAIPLALDDG